MATLDVLKAQCSRADIPWPLTKAAAAGRCDDKLPLRREHQNFGVLFEGELPSTFVKAKMPVRPADVDPYQEQWVGAHDHSTSAKGGSTSSASQANITTSTPLTPDLPVSMEPGPVSDAQRRRRDIFLRARQDFLRWQNQQWSACLAAGDEVAELENRMQVMTDKVQYNAKLARQWCDGLSNACPAPVNQPPDADLSEPQRARRAITDFNTLVILTCVGASGALYDFLESFERELRQQSVDGAPRGYIRHSYNVDHRKS